MTELMSELINVSERRQFRRVFSLVPQEDVVLFSMNGRNHFVAKLLDLSRGGALIYTADPSVSADAGSHYKLYFQIPCRCRRFPVQSDVSLLRWREGVWSRFV